MNSAESRNYAYRYDYPEAKDFPVFEISNILSRQPVCQAAYTQQAVRHDSLMVQYQTEMTPTQIATIADPNNKRYIADEENSLKQAGRYGWPVYLAAELPVNSSMGKSKIGYVGGIGLAAFRQTPLKTPRKSIFKPSRNRFYGDVGNIFVRPNLMNMNVKLQGQGIGTAMLRSLLDFYPDDIQTGLIEYPDINQRILPLITNLGLTEVKVNNPKIWPLIGREIVYLGPSVAELKATLEDKHPWLKNRKPVAA
ncbi:MAG: hypothetical protein NVS1B10_01710 [Candidatus Saccharimonadales bacterium]